jgi:hypothetical protein
MDRRSCEERRAAWQSGTTPAEREAALAHVLRRQMRAAVEAREEPDAADVQPREEYL